MKIFFTKSVEAKLTINSKEVKITIPCSKLTMDQYMVSAISCLSLSKPVEYDLNAPVWETIKHFNKYKIGEMLPAQKIRTLVKHFSDSLEKIKKSTFLVGQAFGSTHDTLQVVVIKQYNLVGKSEYLLITCALNKYTCFPSLNKVLNSKLDASPILGPFRGRIGLDVIAGYLYSGHIVCNVGLDSRPYVLPYLWNWTAYDTSAKPIKMLYSNDTMGGGYQ